MLRLRQVVVAATDLAATRTQIEDELGLPHVWADPGVGYFGVHNALYLIGDCFFEVISPFRDDAAARRFIDRAGHDAGYMAIVQTNEDLDAVRARATEASLRIVFTAEGDGVTGLHFHPADTDGCLLSVDRCNDDAAWPWGGPAWQRSPDRGYRGIARAAFAVADPSAVQARWRGLLGGDVEGTTLEFIPATDGRAGLCEVDLIGPARPPVEIAGVTFSVRPE